MSQPKSRNLAAVINELTEELATGAARAVRAHGAGDNRVTSILNSLDRIHTFESTNADREPADHPLFAVLAVGYSDHCARLLAEVEPHVEKLGVFADREDFKFGFLSFLTMRLRDHRRSERDAQIALDPKAVLAWLRAPEKTKHDVSASPVSECRWPIDLQLGHFRLVTSARATAILCGSVCAHSVYSALRIIETHIEELLGALLVFDALNVSDEYIENPEHAGQVFLGDYDFEDALHVRADLGDVIARATMRGPRPTEMEMALGEKGRDRACQRVAGWIRRVLSDESPRSTPVKAGLRFLIRAHVSREDGHAINLACTALEAVLLDATTTESVVARLSEAIAYRVGRGRIHRERLRRTTKQIYDIRSKYVHTGEVRVPFSARDDCIELARCVLALDIAGFSDEDSGRP